MPPGATPPLSFSYNASTVPILRLALGSDTLPEQELYDLGNSFIRTQLATVQGASCAASLRRHVRQVTVDLMYRHSGTRPGSSRCRERDQRAEFGFAWRHRQDWLAGIPGRSQWQYADRSRVERLAGPQRP